MSTLTSTARPLTHDEVELRLKVLRAMWVLIAARQNDALADQVRDFGDRLKTAKKAGDWTTAREVIAESRRWLATHAGTVTARMTAVFGC